jgi:type I restriction enzyme, R subunit
MTAEQKVLVDLILARDPDSMNERERQRLFSMVAAYVGASYGQISEVENLSVLGSFWGF